MPTNELAVRLHDIAIELENEQKFYVTYNSLKAGAPDARKRREAIKLCTRRTKSAEEREHLRRYFDDVYAMPPANENVLRNTHDLDVDGKHDAGKLRATRLAWIDDMVAWHQARGD